MKPGFLVIFGVGMLASAACGGGGDPEESGEAPSPVPERTAVEALRFGTDLVLSGVVALERDSKGRFIVVDAHEGILVLSPEGERIARVGRQGEGPGEYLAPAGLQVLPGDTLLVFDQRLNRLTTYDPVTFEPVGTLRPAEPGGMLFPVWIGRVEGEPTRYAGLYTVPFGPMGSESEGKMLVRLLDEDGTLARDSLLVLTSRNALVVRRGEGSSQSVSVTNDPFGRTSLFRLGPDGQRIYVAWTDSLAVTVYDLEGNRVDRVEAPAAGSPVTDEQVEALVSEHRTRNDGRGAAPAEDPFIDALRDARTETWPVLWTFTVDDRGRVWAHLREGAGPSGEWAILGPAGGREATVRLPPHLRVLEITAGRVYGTEADSLGVPTIVAYDVKEPDG